MRWWERRQIRRAQEAAAAIARQRYEAYVDNVPAGVALLCGQVVGVDVPPDQVRQHLERDCERCRELRRR